MRKIFVIFLLLLFSVNLFADDDEDKLKLAVMEFENLSGKLSKTMLAGATEYMRSAFVSTNKYVLISKERQENALIKEMKKESYKSCNDKNCQIPLGKALSADTILRTTINFFGGVYTITAELIDLEKEATVSGAKQNFNGSEKSLMQALDRIVVQIAGTSVSYNVSAMQTQEIQGVKLGGVELDTMPKIEVKEANFDRVQNTYTVSELNANVGISLDADPDVLVLYDKCVKADRNGEKNPQNAIDLWSQLSGIEKKNPFIKQANQRAADWKRFVYSKQMGDLFETAKAADKAGQIFPKDAIDAWNNVYTKKGTDPSVMFDNPYSTTASERLNFWKQYDSQIEKYKTQLQKFEEQRKEDTKSLAKMLPLEVVSDAQKRTLLVQYMEIYSPFYGIEDVNAIIYAMDDALAKHLYGLLYNDYLKKEMAEKCDKGNGAACYISASITEVEDPQKANMFFVQSCERGVVNACVKTGKTYYNNKQFKDAAKLFYEACGKDSPEGCHTAAYITEQGMGTEEDLIFLAGAIYKKACDLGYEASCSHLEKKYYGYSPKENVQNKPQKEKIQNKNVTETKTASEETYRPYKAAGISLVVVGAVVAAAGVAGFHIASDKEYNKYKALATDQSKPGNYSSYEEFINDANSHRKKSNIYRALEITSGIVGGAALVTGIALTAIKKEKPAQTVSLTDFSIAPANDGFYASLGFEF